ncbi:SecB-like chaperone SmegB [Mycobacteroides stephanolepidis]|uniref:SecB-like chaperone SmegB n=1 Tax=[Mycobacterium] stephanolepidis TaxID=1520670 RepID=A0A1Z4F0Z8_9MYCO|nr:SecB-like chaperone SmegB [[Mycobacterium] stephanolepidis]
MSETAPHVVTDARDLLGITELSDITYTRLSAQVSDEDDAPFAVQVLVRQGENSIEILCKATLSGEGASYAVDAIGRFTVNEPCEVSGDVLTEFIGKAGVVAIYPYLRNGMVDLASRLGLPRPVIPFLRPEGPKFTPP